MLKCPICGQQNARTELRCFKCGADFHDPDVRALMDNPGAFDDEALLAGVGTLSAQKVLGVTADGLDSGSALTRLALLGAALCFAGFLIPVAADYSSYHFPWAIDPAPVALWFPLAAIAVAVAVAMLHQMAVLRRGAALALVGLAGLLLTPSLGRFGATATNALPIATIALVLGAAAATQRLYAPHSKWARVGLVAAVIVSLAGFLIPISEAVSVLPAELRFYSDDVNGGGAPLLLIWNATSRQHLTFFIGLFSLAPLVLLPGAAAAAFVKPGVWDRGAFALRPLAWLLILFPALLMALQTFNLMGWEVSRVMYDGHLVSGDSFTQAGMSGRTKMMLLNTAFSLWAVFGLVALYRATRLDGDNSEALAP